jgi:hypothetical protein
VIKLGIAIPCYGSKLDVGHAAMWLGLGAALGISQDKFKLQWMSEYHINGIDLCRNTAVWDAMQASCDWVFMIDADTFHRSTGDNGVCDAVGDAGVDIIQMIRDADRGQYAVDGELRDIEMPMLSTTLTAGHNGIALIGAPVHGRGVGDAGVCVQRLEIDADGHYRAGRQASLGSLAGKVQAVGRIGGACIAVNCGWLRQHWPKGPWFEMEHDYTARPRNARGEDYSICDGIYRRGGVVLCDGRFVPAHVDRRRLVGED